MSEKKTEKPKNNHIGHRKRMKDEFLARGLKGMPEHRILELFLFYSIPYSDTNDMAHDLINHFGSLYDVLKASYEDLCEVKGVKEHTATLICLFRQLSMIYLSHEYSSDLIIDNTDALCQYCKTLFINSTVEEIYCICFDDELEVMGVERLTGGTMNTTDLPMRSLLETVLKMKSDRFVLAHNHPNGYCSPSNIDANSTVEIWKFVKNIGFQLIDHVVVGKNGAYSMRSNNILPQLWRKQ